VFGHRYPRGPLLLMFTLLLRAEGIGARAGCSGLSGAGPRLIMNAGSACIHSLSFFTLACWQR